METLTITRPDDWHVHLRRGAMLAGVVEHTAARFGRAVVMPNLSPPVVSVAQALEYRAEIMAALAALAALPTLPRLPTGRAFNPLMSLYLTDNTRPRAVQDAAAQAHIAGFKLYPAGATTNSELGVTRISKVMPALEAMAAHGVVLQVHGEVTDPQVDVFDREAVFIEHILEPLHRELPELRLILEHVTTEQGVQFVRQAGDNVAATITVHHLLFSRNEMFRGGIRPHAYCLPVAKRERHRLALLEAATSADPSFFLGTDSAPHTRRSKESACGCAGIYSAPAALELYAEVFEGMRALDKLEGFASHYGADFYRLKRNPEKLTLKKTPWRMADAWATGAEAGDEIVPLGAGETVAWSVQ